MRKMKIIVQGYGIVTCLDQSKAIEKITHLNPTSLVDQAYYGKGYIGFNLEAGTIADHHGPTTIKLYEINRNNKLSLEDLRNHFRQNWQRFQIDIGERINIFYNQNCIIC